MVIADLFKTASRKRKLINSLGQAFAQDKNYSWWPFARLTIGNSPAARYKYCSIMQMVQSVSHEFFNDGFNGNGEILRIMNMRVSRKTQEQFKVRLEQIAVEYEDQARADAHLPLE